MLLTQLKIHRVRNLTDVSIEQSHQCTVIVGPNASGKTSILEAVHLVSVAKSFRTTHIKQVITHGEQNLQLFAKLISQSNPAKKSTIGIERGPDKTVIRLNGQNIQQLSQMSALLPTQVINPDIHHVLEQGPKYRRQFIDWGVFHVEHQFLATWKDYYRVLKQRNAGLRNKLPKKSITLWDEQYLAHAQNITDLREIYLNSLVPILTEYINRLLGLQVSISYYPGWNRAKPMKDHLTDGYALDLQQGFTRVGPHRADLLLQVDGKHVQHVFSRGQQKLLVCAMRLAQISHLRHTKNEQSVLLVDDLAAELDQAHRAKLTELLFETGSQLFITATETTLLELPQQVQTKMFHVEHGKVKEVVQ